MTNKRLTTSVMMAGAASIAALVLGGHIIPVNDDDGWSVNDQGQTSGDTFLQNAQDQSTA
ncbi:hypothetical protein [Mycobacterium sp. RTGN5]|uniref:hypothetical protein n=1 Tax=Mycobacterium sp. RTGN5 TaxID=3016522 RepID=UPI0029C9565F|nr:hypothetical protein [Mycobacterium sp. RTGN5]